MRETSTNARQNVNLKKEVSTQTNHIEESKFEIDTNTSFNLSEKDKKKKRTNELSETYKPRVPFPPTLGVDSFHSDTLPIPIASNSMLNPKTQFMSILEEKIRKILNKQGSVNEFINYLLNIEKMNMTKNGDVNYFLEIDNKILKLSIKRS